MLVVVGDETHPEVQGIVGHCRGEVRVVSSPEEISAIPNEYFARKSSLFFVCQTTFQKNVWEKCAGIAKKVCTNAKIFDTICNATSLRQQEAARLAEKSDVMIVIGGSHSSNTAKLAAICRPFCRTVQIETASQLDPADFVGARSIAITAGASTPARIIKMCIRDRFCSAERTSAKRSACLKCRWPPRRFRQFRRFAPTCSSCSAILPEPKAVSYTHLAHCGTGSPRIIFAHL